MSSSFTSPIDGSTSTPTGSGGSGGVVVTPAPPTAHLYRTVFDGYELVQRPYRGQAATVTYLYGDPGSAVNETFVCDALEIDVTPGGSELIVPGSMDLTLGAVRYIETSGAVYANVSPATGAGTHAGTLNHMNGKLRLTGWEAGVANSADLHALSTKIGKDIVDQTVIVAPGLPVQVGSVTVTAMDVEGNELVSTADSYGFFDDAGIAGVFHYNTRFGLVRFGDWLVAAGNEGDPDYRAAGVIDGKFWKPRQVLADSIRFNCTILTTTLIDDAVLGFPTGQLPSTGRVPVIVEGDLIAIIHTLTVVVSSASAGGTLNVGRDRLERVWVRDAHGVLVPIDRYSADLDTGDFTWAAPLDLAGWSAPFTIYHRRMFKSPVLDVSLDGTIKLALPVNYDELPEGCLVSSALLAGDVQGRVTNLFHQNSWDGAWGSASPNGTPSAQYNSLDFSILVSNQSSTDAYALVVESDPTKYRIISQHRGVLARNVPMSSDYTLVNRDTGKDEWTVYADGFGLGWLPGNVIVFYVVGGRIPFELMLSVQQGAQIGEVQHLTVEIVGGI